MTKKEASLLNNLTQNNSLILLQNNKFQIELCKDWLSEEWNLLRVESTKLSYFYLTKNPTKLDDIWSLSNKTSEKNPMSLIQLFLRSLTQVNQINWVDFIEKRFYLYVAILKEANFIEITSLADNNQEV